MQGFKRKIVHVIAFELLAIALSGTVVRLLTGSSVVSAAAVAIASSLVAMGWNFVYNAAFEAWEARQARKGRSFLRRACHALGFEAGLMAMLVPLSAWMLGVSWAEALFLNLAMILFFVAYGFVFNLAFDRLFGLPLAAQPQRGSLATRPLPLDMPAFADSRANAGSGLRRSNKPLDR